MEVMLSVLMEWQLSLYVRGLNLQQIVLRPFCPKTALDLDHGIYNGTPVLELFHLDIFTTTGNATATTGAFPSGSHPGIDGLWHHVSFVYDGANITLYVDGAVVGTPEALTGTVQDVTDSVVNGSQGRWYGIHNRNH